MTDFLWGALPYIACTFLVVGTLLRYAFFERNWTTKSSEFLDKKSLKIAGPLFHLGLLLALGGHVMGILVPKSLTEMMGVSESMYHQMALGGGATAGVCLLVGFLLLLRRRFFIGRLAPNTSGVDLFLFAALLFAIGTGCASTLSNVSGAFDYRTSIAPWFRSLLALSPQVSLMNGVPFLFRLHMLAWMLVAILFPFTRLVHCLSFPVAYFWRSRIVYRRR